MVKVAFPSVPFGEFTVVRPFTAPGLFAYRHLQADGLLHPPDLSGGDLGPEERREALEAFIPLMRPLGAVVIFLNVVALEDFIRDLGARLADLPGIDAHFPRVPGLRARVREPNPARPFAQLDRDPIPYLDFSQVNSLYSKCLDVEPIPCADIPKLSDLALVRHTIAHHGAVFRDMDKGRFQYYDIAPGTVVNPPVTFIREVADFTFRSGRAFEQALQSRVFAPLLAGASRTSPSTLLVKAIETFNYLGKIPPPGEPPRSYRTHEEYELEQRRESDRAKAWLTSACLDELFTIYGTPAA